MGIYEFKPKFVDAILSGRKQHTIRGLRAYPDKPGKTMHLYTGLRTKQVKLLMRVPCVKVENILITPGGVIRIDGIYLEDDEREAFAQRDGFANFAEMLEFWRTPKNRLPFRGQIFHWKLNE